MLNIYISNKIDNSKKESAFFAGMGWFALLSQAATSGVAILRAHWRSG